MTNEMDLLESLNPRPEPRHNPGPVPDRRRPGRQHRMVVLAAMASLVLVVLAVVLLRSNGDDRVRATSEPTPDTEQPDEPADAPLADADGAGPTEEKVLAAASIPWPDPIAVELTPDSTPDNTVIELEAPGVIVLDIDTAAFGSLGRSVVACSDFATHSGGGLSCSNMRTSGPVSTDASALFIDEVRSGQTRTVLVELFDESDMTLQEAAAVVAPTDSAAPWIDFEDTFGARVLFIDRVTGTFAITGEGWDARNPIILHHCVNRGYEAAVNPDLCAAFSLLQPDDQGHIDTEASIPLDAFAQELETDFGPRWIVAVQGDDISLIEAQVKVPQLDFGEIAIDDLPATVQVTVDGIRPDEAAEIWVCDTGVCPEPLLTYDLDVALGGTASLAVDVPAGAIMIAVAIDGNLISGTGFAAPVAPIVADGPPPEIVVEPPAVPEPGDYEFTVTGTNWQVAPPIFVLPCESDDLESCDTSNLTAVSPEDGRFEATITYTVGPDGLVIAAGDAAQTQSATFAVSVG